MEGILSNDDELLNIHILQNGSELLNKKNEDFFTNKLFIMNQVKHRAKVECKIHLLKKRVKYAVSGKL